MSPYCILSLLFTLFQATRVRVVCAPTLPVMSPGWLGEALASQANMGNESADVIASFRAANANTSLP